MFTPCLWTGALLVGSLSLLLAFVVARAPGRVTPPVLDDEAAWLHTSGEAPLSFSDLSFADFEPGMCTPGVVAGPDRAPSPGCLGPGDPLGHFVGMDHRDHLVSLQDYACGRPLALLLLCGDAGQDRAAVACTSAPLGRRGQTFAWMVVAPDRSALSALSLERRGLAEVCTDRVHELVLGSQRPESPVAVLLDAARRVVTVFDVVEPAWLWRHVNRRLIGARPTRRGRTVAATAPVLLVPDVVHGDLRQTLRRGDANAFDELRAAIARRVRPEVVRAGFVDAPAVVDLAYLDERSGWPLQRANAVADHRARRFGLLITLASGGRGGGVYFPSYGPDRYLPPPGGALVYPASVPAELLAPRSGKRSLLHGFLADRESAPFSRVGALN